MSREYLEQLEIDEVGKEAFALHLKLEPFSTKWHQHRKHQLIFAEGGLLHFESEEHTFVLPSRFCAWIPSGSYHRLYSGAPALYLRTLYFDPREDDTGFYQRLHLFPVSNLAMEMILQTQRWPLADADSSVQRAFFEAIRQMAPLWGVLPVPLILPVPQHAKLKQVTDFISGQVGEPLALSATAKRFGLSGRTLMRLFRKELGMTFSDFVRAGRVIRALELLAEPGATVTATAYAVGFESLGSFSDAFQRLIRIRPSEYLKNLRRIDS